MQTLYDRSLERINDNDKILTTLDLRFNKIGDKESKALANGLEKNIFLQSLNLRNNQISAVGTKYLAVALKKNNCLRSLFLTFNKVGPEGAKDLADTLEKNTCISSLGLCGNEIGPEGANYLARSLEKNKSLTWLDLSSNKIGSAGIEPLAAALKINTTLDCLNLAFNQVGNEGAKYLANVLEKNTGLTYLNLEKNLIDNPGYTALSNALKNNYTLLNLIGAPTDSQISFYLNRNQQIANCLTPLKEGIDGTEIESLLNKLKELIPEFDSLAEDSYPVEAYRLLTALGHASTLDKKGKIAAILCLLPRFRHQAFNDFAEKTLGQILLTEFNQPLLGLYYLKNHLQNPETKNFALIALFKLNNPDEVFSYKTKQELENLKILSEEEFLTVLSKAADSLKQQPHAYETMLLNALMKAGSNAFSLSTAYSSNAFHKAFKAQYPQVNFFTTIDHCLYNNGKKDNYIMDMRIEPKEEIGEDQINALCLQIMQNKTADLVTIVEDLKQNLEKTCSSEFDELEKQTLIRESSKAPSQNVIPSNHLSLFHNNQLSGDNNTKEGNDVAKNEESSSGWNNFF